ncbi:MAG TPA: cytochrome c oxidase subunit II [Acidimicrobiales bacterium]
MRRPGRARTVLVVAVLALVVLLAACGSDEHPLDTLNPKGPEARSIDRLLDPVLLVAGVVFVFVEAGVLYLAFRFRRRPDDDDSVVPDQIHGHTRLEIGWTVLPALILAGVAVGTIATLFRLSDEPEGAMEVKVYGQQWWWAYQYDTTGDGVSDIITANELVIPAGQPVNLRITARDVIHSFWAPALNGKRDAVPGREHPLTIEADEPGIYAGQCGEYCGLSHSLMRLRVVALAPDDFDAWVEGQLADAAEPGDADAQAGLEVFQQLCIQCHQINGVNEVPLGEAQQVAGVAPNLTHLMSRTVFAGGVFTLRDVSLQHGEGFTLEDYQGGNFDRAALEAWLRDPPGRKPMYPEGNRGMPNLGLTEQQIDQLVAYLQTLE